MTQTRRIILNVLATYGRSLFSLVCGLFTGRWLLEALGTTSYGVFGVVGTIIGCVTVVNQMLSSSVSRYFAYAVGKARSAEDPAAAVQESMGWFNSAVAIHFLIPTALVLVGYPLGCWAIRDYFNIPDELRNTSLWVFTFTMITTYVGMAEVPFRAIYVAHQYIAELTIYSVCQTAANVVFAWILLSYDGDRLLFNAFYVMMIAVVPQFIIAARSFVLFPECRIHFRMMRDRSRYRQLFSFAGWQVLGWIGLTLRFQGLAALVNRRLGLEYNSSLTVANTVSQHTMTFSYAMNGAFNPAIANAAGAGDRPLFAALVLRSCKFGTIMCAVFVVPLCLEMHYVIHLWLTTVPPLVEPLCALMLVTYIVERSTAGYASAIYAMGDIKYNEIIGCVNWTMSFALGCLFVCVFKWGIIGVALAVFVSMNVNAIVKLALAKWQLKMAVRPWWTDFAVPFALVLVVSAVAGGALRLALPESFLRLVLATVVSAGLFMLGSLRFVCDATERAYLRDQLVSRVPALRRFFKV